MLFSIRAATIAAIAAPTIANAQSIDTAAARIDAYHGAIVAVMKQGKALRLPGRQQQFVAIVARYYDLSSMSALIVGSSWAAATPVDRTAFTTALTRYYAYNLATNFTSFGGEKFVVEPNVQRRGSDAIVSSRIIGGGETTQIVYRTRAGRIVDIYAKGVSQISLQRSDFAATVKAGGVAALTKRLNEVTTRNLGVK